MLVFVIFIMISFLTDVAVSLSLLAELVLENDALVLFNVTISGQRETDVLIMFETEPGSALGILLCLPLG